MATIRNDGSTEMRFIRVPSIFHEREGVSLVLAPTESGTVPDDFLQEPGPLALVEAGDLAVVSPTAGDSKIVWVDNQRTDDYVEDGSREFPFKTFPQAFDTGKPFIFLIGSGVTETFDSSVLPFVVTTESHPSGLYIKGFTKELSVQDPYHLKGSGVDLFHLGSDTVAPAVLWIDNLAVQGGFKKFTILMNNTIRGATLIVDDCQVASSGSSGRSIYQRQTPGGTGSLYEHKIQVRGSNALACEITGEMEFEWHADVPQSNIPWFRNARIAQVDLGSDALDRELFFENCQMNPFTFCGGNALHRIHCVNCINWGDTLTPYGKSDLTVCSPATPLVSPGNWFTEWQIFHLDVSVGDPFDFTDFEFEDEHVSGLKIDHAGLSSNLVSFDPDEILEETLDNVNNGGILSAGPTFTTVGDKRAISGTMDAGATPGGTRVRIRWFWNKRNFELQVHPVA